jgi:hypothetical protein
VPSETCMSEKVVLATNKRQARQQRTQTSCHMPKEGPELGQERAGRKEEFAVVACQGILYSPSYSTCPEESPYL